MIEPRDFLRDTIDPALAKLAVMLQREVASDEARLMVLACCMQESSLNHRRQIDDAGNPMDHRARGWPQFERGTTKGAGIKGLYEHPASKGPLHAVCMKLSVPFDIDTIHQAIAWNDELAVDAARLLLWTDPRAIPELEDEQEAWECYLRAWNPGKADRDRWSVVYQQALAALRQLGATMPAKPEPKRATLQVLTAAKGAVEVILPKMKPSMLTGEYLLIVLGMISDALVAYGPLIDPALDQVQRSGVFGSNTLAATLFALGRTAYKAWRTKVAGDLAKPELRSAAAT